MLEALTASEASIHKLKLSLLRKVPWRATQTSLASSPRCNGTYSAGGVQFCLISQAGINEAQMFWAKFYCQETCKYTITPSKTNELYQIWGLIHSLKCSSDTEDTENCLRQAAVDSPSKQELSNGIKVAMLLLYSPIPTMACWEACCGGRQGWSIMP